MSRRPPVIKRRTPASNRKFKRTCLGCRQADFKQALVRLAALPEGTIVDRIGHAGGRGGYLHPRVECLNAFARAKIKRFNSLGRGVDRTERGDLIKKIQARLAPQPSLE